MKRMLIVLMLLLYVGTAYANCDLAPKFAYSTKGKTLVLKNQSKGDYLSVEWNMGDGTISKEIHPKHTYSKPGMYSFSLTIANEEGCSETFEGKVYIFDLKNNVKEEESVEPTEETVTPSVIAENNNTTTQNIAQIAEAKNDEQLKIDNSVMVSASYLTHLNNYPNPFSDRTTISFDLEERAKVALSVYDISGRLVQLLANEEMLQGTQSFEFERQTLASGAYFVKATVAEQTYTRKMVIQ